MIFSYGTCYITGTFAMPTCVSTKMRSKVAKVANVGTKIPMQLPSNPLLTRVNF